MESQNSQTNAGESRKRQVSSSMSESSASNQAANEVSKRPKIEAENGKTETEMPSKPWHSGCEYCCQICGKMHYALNELLFHVRTKHNMTGSVVTVVEIGRFSDEIQ